LISGGQSGVDRAALDFAIARGIPYGGWCPRGGWAEDQPEPPGLLAAYPCLRETPSANPAERTRWNVRDSDATLILALPARSGSPGTEATADAADELGRPLLRLEAADLLDPGAGARELAAARASVEDLLGGLPEGCTLNVAGPRGSEAEAAYARTLQALELLLG